MITHNNMHELYRHNDEWNKADAEENILCGMFKSILKVQE